MYTYVVYGLGMSSELRLPELVPSDLPADVWIRLAPGEMSAVQMDDDVRLVTGRPQECTLSWRDIGTFVVRHGREIVIDPASGVEEGALRPFVLGSCLGVLLLQRGLMVFHASVVSLDSIAVAFLARKGYGKSTLAAALHARGHDLVADDIVVLDREDDGLIVRPGYPQLKLWPDSVSVLGQDPNVLATIHPHIDKRAWRLTDGFSDEPLPLGCIYVLGGGDELCINPLSTKQALMHVLPHWYGAMFDGDLLGTFGLASHFGECTDLVKAVPAYAFQRPLDLSLLDESARMVERHFAGLAAGAGLLSASHEPGTESQC